MTFEDCLAIVLEWEGGYSDHPLDKGGPTNHGVTHKTLARWRKRDVTAEEVAALGLDEARSIYEHYYWQPCRCADMPSGVDLLVFDSAVNQGPTNAIKFLQRSLSVSVDGILGPKTLTAVQSADRSKLIQEFAARRAVHYAGLQREFWLGWFRRLASVYAAALAAGE